MKFITTEDTVSIDHMRKKLYCTFAAPLDAMWEMLHIASAQDFLIEKDDQTIGYCSISEEKALLQLYLDKEYIHLMRDTVKSLISSQMITSAQLSSHEPVSFNACLYSCSSIQTDTLCFQYGDKPSIFEPDLGMEWVREAEIPLVQAFFKEQITFEDNFGYTKNLVDRKEIYLIKEGDKVIATSECRWSDTQSEVADLGVIVHKDKQGQGLATRILQHQVQRVLEANRRPICSTTIDNIASQKAIEKAGFYCSHIIFDIQFATKT